MALLTVMFFGAALAGPALLELTWQIAHYTVLSLTAVRMIPVAISLVGLHLRCPTLACIGWFGPRGLASILFGLFVLEEEAVPFSDDILLVVTWTLLASVFLHGMTSVPLSNRYATWFRVNGRPTMAEAPTRSR